MVQKQSEAHNLDCDYLKTIKELNSSGFYIRLRKEKNRDGKVYYDGYNPFILDKNGKIKLQIDKFLRLNSTNIKKSLEKKNKQELMSTLKNSRHLFYENYILTKITFTKGKKISDEKWERAARKLEDMVKVQIKKKQENYIINCNIENINLEYDIAKLMYHDYKKGRENIFKNITFDYKSVPKKLTLEKIKTNSQKLIKNYEIFTKIELEKKYQHQFLLHHHQDTNLFPTEVIPFEEEYYITEGENTKKFKLDNNGRIDCIFYSITKENKLTDLYLIEIKVDDKVIDAKNQPGILEHLQDINTLMTNQELKSYFLTTLIDNINYRRETLGEKRIVEEKVKIHFYTVIGFTSALERTKVEQKINNPKYKAKLEFLMNEIKEECDGKIFFDLLNWNPEDEHCPFQYKRVL